VKIYQRMVVLLNTQEQLDFLLKLTVKDLEKMVGIVRERVDG
jgi:hypothetical protein